jgi:3-hydroxyisobutyrate dehydrogenase-like beta-hydroxyacid dehydrogenase
MCVEACAFVRRHRSKTFHFGDQPSSANLIKLSGNFLIASVLESLSEALALVGKAGIDQRQYLDFLTSTLFVAPVYKTPMAH